MKDRLGLLLAAWRIRAVLPHVHGRLLDIGCGENALVKAYEREGTGVDVHPWPGVDLVTKDASELPFDGESFDTVTIVAALNHMANREAVLAEAHRLLTPGGRLVVTTLSPRVSRVWHAVRGEHDDDQRERGIGEGEVLGFTGPQLKGLLVAAGFGDLVEIRFMLGLNRLIVARKGNERSCAGSSA